MNYDTSLDLEQCTEYRQALRTRSPGIVHGTAVLLIVLLAAAITWMSLTRANLVVTGAGRVRPISDTQTDGDQISEEISSQRDGRVAEVKVKVGDEIKNGDVLIRLDTNDLDVQIEKSQATIAAGKRKLEEASTSMRLLKERFQSALDKAKAEWDDALAEYELKKLRREEDIKLAQIALAVAQDKVARARPLAQRGSVSQQAFVEFESKVLEAKKKLQQAQLPLNNGKTHVLHRAVELNKREHEVEMQKLRANSCAIQDEIDAAIFDLAKLQIQKRQSVITASTDGIVTTATVKVGDIVQTGKIGITMAAQRGFEFEVEVSSADVAHLQPGLPVQIKMDAFDYQKYGILSGTVRFVAPDSAVKELGEGKQAAIYTIKVTVSEVQLCRGNNRGTIKLGMTGKAEIVTDNESILLILVRKMRQKISLG